MTGRGGPPVDRGGPPEDRGERRYALELSEAEVERYRLMAERARAADRSAVADAVAKVGLAASADRTIATLSGGQHRRALIARALASAPELLVLGYLRNQRLVR